MNVITNYQARQYLDRLSKKKLEHDFNTVGFYVEKKVVKDDVIKYICAFNRNLEFKDCERSLKKALKFIGT